MEMHKLSIADLRKGLDSKDFSAAELLKHFMDRTEAASDLNSYICLNDAASTQAEAAQAKIDSGKASSLTGIPLGVKDLILTKDLTTTAASKFLENFIPPYSATVVNKLLAEDAVITGKNNLDEFAMGSSNETSAFGAVKNPWDKTKVPGGSSGGSVAAVAAGLAKGSLGTDTGGSIRQPAAFCGVVGIKPTYGRVSRYGVVAYASSLDQVGPIADSVEDTAIILNAISGKDPLDATSVDLEVPDFTANLGQDIKGLKVGMPKEYFIDGIQEEVKLAVEAAIKQLESLGAEIVEISLPHTEAAIATYYIVAPAEASSNLGRYDGIRYGKRTEKCDSLFDTYANSRSEGFGLEVKRRILVGTYVLSAGYYDAYYIRAQKVRRLIQNDFENAFKDQCDIIATPVTPTTAFGIGEKSDPISMYLNDIFTIPVNMAGLPAMSVPCGFDQNNLPIGLHLIGKPWAEAEILKVAHAYEQSTDWKDRKCYD